MKKIRAFLNGVKKEMGRVKWPDKKYMFKASTAVIIFGIFFAGFFFLIDLSVALIRTWLG